MVTLRTLALEDGPALARIYSGASIRHTTGKPLTLDQAHEKIRTALARATETPRAQWSWGIVATDEMIGLIALRRRTSSMGTLSYILREDTWGNGYATEAVKHVVDFAFTTAGLERLEAMHHPTIRPPAVSWPKSASPVPVHPTGASRTDPLCRTRCTPCRASYRTDKDESENDEASEVSQPRRLPGSTQRPRRHAGIGCGTSRASATFRAMAAICGGR